MAVIFDTELIVPRTGATGLAVVAAAVHLAGIDARPRQAGHLLDRNGVHVGAQAEGAPAAVADAQHAHHAGDGDAGMDLVASGAQLLGDQCTGGVLLETELRVAVNGIAPGRHLFGIDLGRRYVSGRHLAHQ